jgi:hypothetical protein
LGGIILFAFNNNFLNYGKNTYKSCDIEVVKVLSP